MKSTGMTRSIDALGRIVIPMELRRTMGINVEESLEIFVDGEKIVLQKYQPNCAFCGEWKDNMIYRNNKHICRDCIKEMSKQVALDTATSKRR